MTTTPKPPSSFLVISIIALIWNLIGIMAFSLDALITPEAIEALPAEEKDFTNPHQFGSNLCMA